MDNLGAAPAEIFDIFVLRTLSETRSKHTISFVSRLVSWLDIDIMESGEEYDGSMSVEEVTDDEAPKKPPPGWQKQTVKPPPVLSRRAAQNVCFCTAPVSKT